MISLINIWNYVKTANRGVREIDIFLDEHLVYCGNLNNPKEEPLTSVILDP